MNEKTLLEECLETLTSQVAIVPDDESSKTLEIFETVAPFCWSRINWEKVDRQQSLESTHAIPFALQELLGNNINQDIYIFWNDASLPVIKTKLSIALTHIEHIGKLGFETWFFNTTQWYVIELYYLGEIHVGKLPDLQTAELYNKDETIIFKNNGQKHYSLIPDKSSRASEVQTLTEFLLTIPDINIIDVINKLKNDNSSHSKVINDITLIKSSEGKVELRNGTNSLIISFENLKSIVNKWCSLLKHNVPYIILNLKGSLYSEDVYSLKGTQSIDDMLK